jgi:hypothetical protein
MDCGKGVSMKVKKKIVSVWSFDGNVIVEFDDRTSFGFLKQDADTPDKLMSRVKDAIARTVKMEIARKKKPIDLDIANLKKLENTEVEVDVEE